MNYKNLPSISDSSASASTMSSLCIKWVVVVVVVVVVMMMMMMMMMMITFFFFENS